MKELQDYVFLSDSDTFETYMVERDGAVWRLPPSPKAVFHPDHRQPPLLDWRTRVSGKATWRWRRGWLPVLEIRGDGTLLELHAAGGRLHARLNGKTATVHDRGGAHAVGADAFMAGVTALERAWEGFFAGTRQPSPLEGEAPEAWRAAIVQGFLAGCGKHPKYGVGSYHDRVNDGFPPTTIAMVSLLLEMGKQEAAADRLAYYLERFVMEDGRIDYYGPSLAEYGMLLELAARCANGPDGADWLARQNAAVQRLARLLLRCGNPIVSQQDTDFPELLAGVPEADTKDRPAIYVHNNAWVARGLASWSRTAQARGLTESAAECALEAERLRAALRNALDAHRMADGLPPYRLPSEAAIPSFADSRDATYANYRYYPELLESGFLKPDEALAVVRAREERGGEAEGMTLFGFGVSFPTLTHLPALCADNWPIASYGIALADLGERERLERVIHSHYLHHQSRDTFTAYESVELDTEAPCRRAVTDWCVPAQLAYPRLLLRRDRREEAPRH